MVRINKIYTKAGDTGETQVIGGILKKSHPRLEVTGALDELNALLGQARGLCSEAGYTELSSQLETIQHQLFDLGAEVATVDAERLKTYKRIDQKTIQWLEDLIDQITEGLPELKSFVLPGGTTLNASLHLARTVCRRAERAAWTLSETGKELIPEHACIYLNRLSDLLFAMARQSSKLAGTPEFLWKN
jgi:cob(I)alamin adenosyltransferase